MKRICNRRFNKNKLSHWFSEGKYSSRAKFLCGDLDANFWGMLEIEADCLLTRKAEGIFKREDTDPNTREATEAPFEAQSG